MTYFEFLGIFLFTPIVALLAATLWDRAREREIPQAMRAWPPTAAILLHSLIALLYTTVWDNYLVATRVWWYDPALVTGLTLAYVPIEEYTFFIVQPILAGLWLIFLLRRLHLPDTGQAAETVKAGARMRLRSLLAMVAIWLGSVALLVSGWQPGTYMGLELVWAVPPIAMQLAFGADILWRYRRLLMLVIVPLTLYLSVADAIAIQGGIWTINPQKSVDFLLGGILPFEEFLFFLLTNTLVTFGVTLVLSQISHQRIGELVAKLKKQSSINRQQPAGS